MWVSASQHRASYVSFVLDSHLRYVAWIVDLPLLRRVHENIGSHDAGSYVSASPWVVSTATDLDLLDSTFIAMYNPRMSW